MVWLLSQIILTGWEPFLQLGFAAFVATYLLWRHFQLTDAVEKNNRIAALGDLKYQRDQQRVMEVVIMAIHKKDGHENEICKHLAEQLKQMQTDSERQSLAFEAEIKRNK